MKRAEDECKINGLQVREVRVQMGEPLMAGGKRTDTFAIEAVYATAEISDKGEVLTHGRCTAGSSVWSQRTWEALHELIESMEDDLLPQHFKTQEVSYEGTQSRGLGEGAHQV